jgi:hypothetical protein
MKLLIKQSAGALHTLQDVDAALSVAELKALLSVAPFSVPVEQQRLVYKGHVLKDSSTLADYGAARPGVGDGRARRRRRQYSLD